MSDSEVRLVIDEAEQAKEAGKRAASQEDREREALLYALGKLGQLNVGDDKLVFEGNKFILPERYEHNLEGARRWLREYENQREKGHVFRRVFKYRPRDGAAAFTRALRKLFNHSGIGETTYGPFGMKFPPELVSIEVGVGETLQVPWGAVSVDQLGAVFHLSIEDDRELGMLFELGVEAPRKYRSHLEAFFDQVELELRESSIYKGKAINGAETPGFLDLSTVDPSKVIYAREVETQLGANFWTLIERADLMRELNIPLKRAVLVSGPYGSGKTLAGMLTAQRAVAHGFTFIQVRPGKDNLFQVLTTAQLYAPAVVWFEDVDVLTDGGDAQHISKVLDALDGIGNKGIEVLAGFTTNHVDKIPRGLLRPGRIDSVIPIGELDRHGVERLVRATIPTYLISDEVDFDKVYEAFSGFMPAFYREAIDRAMRYTINRTGGTDLITTDDLTSAAAGLRPQLELMNQAEEGVNPHSLDRIIGDRVVDALVDKVTVAGRTVRRKEDDS